MYIKISDPIKHINVFISMLGRGVVNDALRQTFIFGLENLLKYDQVKTIESLMVELLTFIKTLNRPIEARGIIFKYMPVSNNHVHEMLRCAISHFADESYIAAVTCLALTYGIIQKQVILSIKHNKFPVDEQSMCEFVSTHELIYVDFMNKKLIEHLKPELALAGISAK